jgi:hypothetical protein
MPLRDSQKPADHFPAQPLPPTASTQSDSLATRPESGEGVMLGRDGPQFEFWRTLFAVCPLRDFSATFAPAHSRLLDLVG